MKTIRFAGSLFLATILAACSAGAEADDDVVAEEPEIVSNASYKEISYALNLTSGESDEAQLRAGDCHRALVQSVEGIPVYSVKQYLNGAIIFPADGNPQLPTCVDVHGANKISFSGVMLDAVIRFGLGKLVAVVRDAAEGVRVRFANGTMQVFTATREVHRFEMAVRKPYELPVFDGPSIAGSVQKITLTGVEATMPLAGGNKVTRDVDIDGAAVWLAYRFAWQSAVKSGALGPAADVVGTFTRKVKAYGDAGGTGYTFAFTNAELKWSESHNMSVQDPQVSETIAIATPNPQKQLVPVVSCERKFPDNGIKRPDYGCSGI